jgi:hypothetical protein
MSHNGAAAVNKLACTASSAAYLEAGAEQQDPPGLGTVFDLEWYSVFNGPRSSMVFGLERSSLAHHCWFAGPLRLSSYHVYRCCDIPDALARIFAKEKIRAKAHMGRPF